MDAGPNTAWPTNIAGEWNGIPRESHNLEIAGSTPVPATMQDTFKGE